MAADTGRTVPKGARVRLVNVTDEPLTATRGNRPFLQARTPGDSTPYRLTQANDGEITLVGERAGVEAASVRVSVRLTASERYSLLAYRVGSDLKTIFIGPERATASSQNAPDLTVVDLVGADVSIGGKPFPHQKAGPPLISPRATPVAMGEVRATIGGKSIPLSGEELTPGKAYTLYIFSSDDRVKGLIEENDSQIKIDGVSGGSAAG